MTLATLQTRDVDDVCLYWTTALEPVQNPLYYKYKQHKFPSNVLITSPMVVDSAA